VGWLPLSVSQAVCNIDVEIVGWLPQLDSRTLDNKIVRVINNSDKHLLNQIVRASTSRMMKFCTCWGPDSCTAHHHTHRQCESTLHRHWWSPCHLNHRSNCWLFDCASILHRLPRHDPILNSTGIHGAIAPIVQSRMHLSRFEINCIKSLSCASNRPCGILRRHLRAEFP